MSVTIPVYNARGRALKSQIFRRTVGGSLESDVDNGVTIVRALEDVTLRIEHGDRVAIVGGNGAGKTTLLRVMSRIYEPTAGRAEIEGAISSLTDLAVGMDPEATGYENIIIRGAILGLSRQRSMALISDIEEFTELGEYMHLPIRTYSSGMVLRLAFAISTAVKPEIIILDEMISAGDASFIDKARARIAGLIDNASIMVMASHDANLIRQFCTHAVWLSAGRLMAMGDAENVLEQYLNSVHAAAVT